MKRINIILTFLIAFATANSQPLLPQNSPNATSPKWIQVPYLGVDSALIIKGFRDTTFKARYPTLVVRLQDTSLYFSKGNGGTWAKIGSGGSVTIDTSYSGLTTRLRLTLDSSILAAATNLKLAKADSTSGGYYPYSSNPKGYITSLGVINIYNSNGTLTSNRIVSGALNSIDFISIDTFKVKSNNSWFDTRLSSQSFYGDNGLKLGHADNDSTQPAMTFGASGNSNDTSNNSIGNYIIMGGKQNQLVIQDKNQQDQFYFNNFSGNYPYRYNEFTVNEPNSNNSNWSLKSYSIGDAELFMQNVFNGSTVFYNTNLNNGRHDTLATRYFVDSVVGGASFIPTLQQVTDIGNSTTTPIGDYTNNFWFINNRASGTYGNAQFGSDNVELDSNYIANSNDIYLGWNKSAGIMGSGGSTILGDWDNIGQQTKLEVNDNTKAVNIYSYGNLHTQFNHDGSGKVANGNVTWDSVGSTLIGQNVSRLTVDNPTNTLDWYSNDSYLNLNGSTRRFRFGDWTYDWYGTSIDANDDVSAKTINYRAYGGHYFTGGAIVMPTSGAVITADVQANQGVKSDSFTIKGSDGVAGYNGGGDIIIQGGASFTGSGESAGDVKIKGGIDNYAGALVGGYIRMYTNSLERVTIKSEDGFVGFNNNSPTEMVDVVGNIKASGNVTANSFITNGGTSSQFVKGDGSLDNNTYLSSADTSNMLLPYLRKADTIGKFQPYNANTTILGNTTTGSGGIIVLSGSPTLTLPSISAINVSGGILGLPTGSSGTVALRGDSTIFQTKYRSDTSRTNIYLTLNGKVNKSDSTSGGYYPYSSNPKGYLTSYTVDSTVYATRARLTQDSGILAAAINLKLNTADSTITGYSTRANVTRDSGIIMAAVNTKGSGTVTSVATGYGLTGGTITTSGTVIVDSSTILPLSTITLNTSGNIHNTPINFTRVGGAWSGTMTLATQSAYTVFGRASGSGTPSFVTLDSNYFAGLWYRYVQGSISAGRGWNFSSGVGTLDTTKGYSWTATQIVGQSLGQFMSIGGAGGALLQLGTTGTTNQYFGLRRNASTTSGYSTFYLGGTNTDVDAGSVYYIRADGNSGEIRNWAGSGGGFYYTWLAGNSERMRLSTNSGSGNGGYNLLLGTTTDDVTNKLQVNGSIGLKTAGNKLNIATGTNASVGTATLSSGTVTVSTTAITSSSKVFLTLANCSTCGSVYVGTIVNATSFVINSTNILDASNVNWWIVN